MSLPPLLEVKALTKIYKVTGGLGIYAKTIKAVDSVSLIIPSDEPVINTLVGESGSGKSTIARMVLGLLEPTSGEILYKGKSLKWLKRKAWMAYLREVQPIFQDPYSVYNPFYRVEHTLKIAIKKFRLASSNSNAHEIIIKALEDMGLRPQDILGRYPHQISGGERQRLMLARILIIEPKLIVADEPVSMIDASLRSIFMDHLKSFKEKIGTSSLYITHDLNMASYISDNITVLCKGRIVEEGPTESIVEDPLHPYTRLLVDSIPIPDPKERWRERVGIELVSSTFEKKVERGCIFLAKCPHVMEKCRNEVPNPLTLGSNRKVACFLY